MHLLGRHAKGVGKLRAKIFSRYPTERLGVRPNSEKILLPQDLGWPHGEVLGGLRYDLELPGDAKVSIEHAGESDFTVWIAYWHPHTAPVIRFAATIGFGGIDQYMVELFEKAKADIARKLKDAKYPHQEASRSSS